MRFKRTLLSSSVKLSSSKGRRSFAFPSQILVCPVAKWLTHSSRPYTYIHRFYRKANASTHSYTLPAMVCADQYTTNALTLLAFLTKPILDAFIAIPRELIGNNTPFQNTAACNASREDPSPLIQSQRSGHGRQGRDQRGTTSTNQ